MPLREAAVSTTALTLILLAIAVALTFLVGRILLASGEPFLEEVFRDKDVARSVNRLLSVLFHLVTLGVLAIVSALPPPVEGELQGLIARTGVVLLIVGIAYGVSMLVLIKIRERRRAAEIQERVQDKLSDRGVSTRPVTPDPL
jgi:protein-S-isoprenylcysteine O-methyltransferase Ste14